MALAELPKVASREEEFIHPQGNFQDQAWYHRGKAKENQATSGQCQERWWLEERVVMD
jgi:hypothetical protein